MSYLTITEVGSSASGKTGVWIVRSRSGKLGTIRWFPRWRQYAFFPIEDTIYNAECLAEIGAFCMSATQEHRRARREVSV